MKSSDAGEKAAGKRCKDVLGNAFFSRVVEKVQTDEDHENHEELENFCPTGFVFNEVRVRVRVTIRVGGSG